MKKLAVAFMVLFGGAYLYAGKKIVVDLSKQEAYAYENGHLVFSGNVSTGKPGKRTPVGRFRVLEKDIDHVSSKYPRPNGGAKMNYMLRLTNYGVAMHLGYVPNYPASHGCIRMENGFAQKMYHWAKVGTPVIIKGTPPRFVQRGSSFSSRYSYSSSNAEFKRGASNHYRANDPLLFMSSIPSRKEAYKRIHTKKRHKQRYQRISEEDKRKPLDMLKG